VPTPRVAMPLLLIALHSYLGLHWLFFLLYGTTFMPCNYLILSRLPFFNCFIYVYVESSAVDCSPSFLRQVCRLSYCKWTCILEGSKRCIPLFREIFKNFLNLFADFRKIFFKKLRTYFSFIQCSYNILK
jgi:hypothetical protein